MVRRQEGLSSQAIACELKRAPSTISRELKRHRQMPGCAHLPYEATRVRAHLARFTRRRPRKLAVDSPLFAHVRTQLSHGLSPDQIAGRLRREYPGCYGFTVSHETIYTALPVLSEVEGYALPRGALRQELIGYLRQGHVNRWRRQGQIIIN
jgi:IS30 family transposase